MRYSGPGYYESYKVLTLESNLYDTATQQLVWSMQSENFDPSTPAQVIEEQIGLTIKTLGERGLISAKPRMEISGVSVLHGQVNRLTFCFDPMAMQQK